MSVQDEINTEVIPLPIAALFGFDGMCNVYISWLAQIVYSNLIILSCSFRKSGFGFENPSGWKAFDLSFGQ